MTLQTLWLTRKGTQTTDNRDYCGIAERDDACLYFVVDGSTNSRQGGALANALVTAIVDEFLSNAGQVDHQYLREIVSTVHENLRRDFPADAASYLIAVYCSAGHLHTLHAGDCRLGRLDGSGCVRWLSPAHTLATALGPLAEDVLAASSDRHQITRCFRGRRLDRPEYHCYSLYADDSLIIATDGFWGDTYVALQGEMLQAGSLDACSSADDVSCLSLSRIQGSRAVDVAGENFYSASTMRDS